MKEAKLINALLKSFIRICSFFQRLPTSLWHQDESQLNVHFNTEISKKNSWKPACACRFLQFATSVSMFPTLVSLTAQIAVKIITSLYETWRGVCTFRFILSVRLDKADKLKVTIITLSLKLQGMCWHTWRHHSNEKN